MNRRAVTLLEVLIVIALLLAIGAIVTPLMQGQLREQSFRSTMENIEQRLLLARSEAQRRGQMIEVIYDGDPPRIIVRAFAADGDRDGGGGREFGGSGRARGAPGGGNRTNGNRGGGNRASGNGLGDDGPESGGADDDPEREALDTSWSVRRLASGLRLQRERPENNQNQALGFGSAAPDPGRVPGRVPGAAPAERFRLALYLPDGSAAFTRTAWLVDGDDRVTRIRVSDLTGLPRLERQPRSRDGVGGQELELNGRPENRDRGLDLGGDVGGGQAGRREGGR